MAIRNDINGQASALVESDTADGLVYLHSRAIVTVELDRDNVPFNRSVTGYGSKLPTPYRVKLTDKRWRRVYAVSYGNAASLYVLVEGQTAYLDAWAEGYLEDLGNSEIESNYDV